MSDITIPGIIKALVRSEERKTELQMRIADIANESLESLRALVAERDAARIGLAVEKAARVKVESELAAAHALIAEIVRLRALLGDMVDKTGPYFASERWADELYERARKAARGEI